MKTAGRIGESIANICGYFAGWLVPLMMLLVLFEVFMRYVLNRPPAVADEFSAYMLVVLAFLGAARTWKEKGHVRITALVRRLPQRVSSWIRLITLVFALVFTLALTQVSCGYLAFSFQVHMASATHRHFPWQGPQMAIPIGYALLCVLIIIEIAKAITDIRSGRSVDKEVTL